jgi:hypothetical protein
MPEHFGWWLLTMACIAWYSTITIYVSIKGVADICQMLKRLSSRSTNDRAIIDSNQR